MDMDAEIHKHKAQQSADARMEVELHKQAES